MQSLTSRPTPSSAASDQLFQQNQFAQADEAYAVLLQAEPTHEWAALQHARCAVQMGEGRLAQDRFVALLKAYPDNFSGWLEAGHLYRQQSAFEQALASYQRAMVVAPTRYEAPLGEARLLEDMGRREEGAALYHRASVLVPVDKRHFMHQRMAKFRQERGDTSAALDSLRQALLCADALTPALPLNDHCELLIDLGELLLRINAREDAMSVLTQASQATAEATLVRLAETSFRFSLWQESQAVLQRNVELHPNSASALWNLAHGYSVTWEMDLAIATLERAEAITPQPGAASLRASVAGRLGDADTALAAYAEIAEKEGPLSKRRSSTAMASLYSDKLSPNAVATLHRELFEPMGDGARSRDSFANPRQLIRVSSVPVIIHLLHSLKSAGIERTAEGRERRGVGGRTDHGVTGLALLAMLGAGNTHRDGPHASAVDRGIRFLVGRQRADGSFAGDAEFFAALYCHGMATIAVAECLAITGDESLRPAVDRAVAHTLAMQHPRTGGWRYAAGDRGDTSQCGWQVMVLATATATTTTSHWCERS
jgi:tetratricopeptide (TPR) repeat protein